MTGNPVMQKSGNPVGCRASKLSPIDFSSQKSFRCRIFVKIFDILGAMIFETYFADFITVCDVTNGAVIKKSQKT